MTLIRKKKNKNSKTFVFIGLPFSLIR